MTYIFYHKADHDGKLSAHLYNKFLSGKGEECKLFGCDYGEEPYQDIESVTPDIDVVLLDFCFEKEGVMETVKNNARTFIWIEHHQKSIDLFKHLNINGLQSKEKACCQLTWEYLYPDSREPVAVTFLGLFDSWKHEDRKDIVGFEYYLQSRELPPTSPEWKYWLSLGEKECQEYSDYGYVCYKRDLVLSKNLLDKTGFTTVLHGYKVLAVNTTTKGSQVFGKQLGLFDFCIGFRYTGNQWVYSVYSLTRDCAEFSHLYYGGGGHKGAAGFQTPDLIFSINRKEENNG